jgi:hypothetical protein
LTVFLELAFRERLSCFRIRQKWQKVIAVTPQDVGNASTQFGDVLGDTCDDFELVRDAVVQTVSIRIDVVNSQLLP